jgi:hypothetical protein
VRFFECLECDTIARVGGEPRRELLHACLGQDPSLPTGRVHVAPPLGHNRRSGGRP